jgi:chemotaxis protein methyltransferase CheR
MVKVDSVERHLFLEGILLKYGYDFRQYASAALDRRLAALLREQNQTSLLPILKNTLASESEFRKILPLLTINTTEFFRDPEFFISLKENVFSVMATYPSIKIWIAGSSTGEEAISLAILLKEADLYYKSTLYVSDINPNVLAAAQKAIYHPLAIQQFMKNYNLVSKTKSPSDYYTAEYGLVKFNPDILKNMIFLEHNLAVDNPFEEMHLILCRNVLIYFDRNLQNRAFDLFTRSLIYKGFLGIGSKESLRLSNSHTAYNIIDSPNNIFQLTSKNPKSGVKV